MNKDIIYALTGRPNGYVLFPELDTRGKREWKEDELIEAARTVLGTEDEYWAYSVYQIATSIAGLMPLDLTGDVDVCLDGRFCENLENPQLIADPSGAALIRTSYAPITSWPVDRVVHGSYEKNAQIAYLNYGGKAWRCNCSWYNGVLRVTWPAEFGIRGAWDLPKNEDITFDVKIRPAYPVNTVVAMLKRDAQVYNLLESTELTHSLFYADTPYEAIGVAAKAMVEHLRNINT